MTTLPITPADAAKLLVNSDGKFFTAKFIKRTTGEARTMNCRTGVKKHLKGGAAAYNFSEKSLLSVWESASGEYRSIPLDRLLEVTLDDVLYVVEHGEPRAS